MLNMFCNDQNPFKGMIENCIKMHPLFCNIMNGHCCSNEQSNSNSCCSNQQCNSGSYSNKMCDMSLGGHCCPLTQFCKMISCCKPYNASSMNCNQGTCCNNVCNSCHYPMMDKCCNSFDIYNDMIKKYMHIICCARHMTENMMCKMKGECCGEKCNPCDSSKCDSSCDKSCKSSCDSHKCCIFEHACDLDSKIKWWSESFGKLNGEIAKLNEQATINMKLIGENLKTIMSQMQEYKKAKCESDSHKTSNSCSSTSGSSEKKK